MISESCKQRIIDAADCLDVVSDFLDLRKKGVNHWASCPFHSERSASFCVTPSRNTWHCFGCGKHGDAVAFLMEHKAMSFVEALEWLARKYHIDIQYERRERSEAEQDASRHRESLMALLDTAQRFFTEQLQEATPEAEAARQYAYGRWGEQFCQEAGIGYAPKGNRLLQYAAERRLNLDHLKEVSLVSDGERGPYDFFRERVTIPIRNRWGKVVAFTARYIGDRPDAPKYINSRNSSVYAKEESVFGIDVAARQARSSGCYIMVEGAPDVLRLQSVGLNEAVATLGTAQTDKHLEALRRGGNCKTLRYVPDSDPPKGGELYPAGVAAVMKNGAAAMRLGFEVSVRELPRTKEDDAQGVKRDPDSYITGRDVYLQLEDKPFVVWYAEKRFVGADTQDLKLEVVKEVADLLVFMDDELNRDICIDRLSKLYGKAKTWRDALKTAGRKLKEKSYEEPASDVTDTAELQLLRKTNLIIRNNMYYTPGKEEGLERLSNFILRPLVHVKSKDNSLRLYRIINEYGHEEALELPQKTLGSLQAFQIAIESQGTYIWHGKADKFNNLKEYLYAITESAENINVLGWQDKEGFYAFADGIWADGCFTPVDEMGLVRHQGRTFYLPAFSKMYATEVGSYNFERKMEYRHGNDESLRDFALRIASVFGDNGKIGFAFVLACLFREHIYSQTNYFPLLNLFGIKGSGKTALATTLATFYTVPHDPPKLANATIPAMSYMLNHARNAMVVLDEYTNLLPANKVDLLKAIWGGTSNTKMNMGDTTQGMVSNPVYSGVIFCGQHQPTFDDALFSRCIHLAFTQTSHGQEEKRRFEDLRDRASLGNAHLIMPLLTHIDTFKANFMPMFKTVSNELSAAIGDDTLQDRLLNDWAIPLATYRVLETCADMPFSYAELFGVFVRGLRYQHSMAQRTSETADFWSMLNGMRMIGKVVDGTHYDIKREPSFLPEKAKPEERVNFPGPHQLLYLDWASISELLKARPGLNQMKMDLGALENYLRHSPHFLGMKRKRFKKIKPNGEPDYIVETVDGKTTRRLAYGRATAMVFDYEALKTAADIDLETFYIVDGAPDYDDEPQPEPPAPTAPQQSELPF